ncbi:hypothetical protein ABIC98_001567 [Arthrobacter nitrophenolicus]|uniref:Uncharacterized protein n=1 Tax=Arthrobacter nitrophenolicus TaxID=683150 RepID=A0ACC6TE67_9MICC
MTHKAAARGYGGLKPCWGFGAGPLPAASLESDLQKDRS